jgi:voltage-gated potassium channel
MSKSTHSQAKRGSIRRVFRRNWRDLRVLSRAFSRPLLVFLAIIVVFGGAYFVLSRLAGQAEPNSPVEAMFWVLAMIFLQANVAFPDQWYLQIFFFAMPVVGLAWFSAGAANLGVKLFNRSARGQEWEVALASMISDHVVVCGLGKLGFRVTRQLLEFGQQVVAIERDADKPFIGQVRELDVPVIIGDARVHDILSKAGIERAAAVVCCTQDDLANLDIALDAQEANPDIKVVLRMFDDDLAGKVAKGFGIRTAFSTSALAAPAFAAAATRAHIDYSFFVGGTLLHVSQVSIDARSPLVGLTMEIAEQKYNMTIVMHRAGDHLHLHPQHDEIIHANDILVVFATLDTLGLISPNNQNSSTPAGRNHVR